MNSKVTNNSAKALGNAPEVPSDTATVRALVVDDEPLVLWTTVKRLERRGWRVTGAESGRDAETQWFQGEFDVILMDYRLSDALGVDVVGRMRKAGRDEPVVCLTAESERIDAEACRTLAIGAVLAKPVDIDLLVATASRLIGACSCQEPQEASSEARRAGRFRIAACPSHVDAGAMATLAERCEDEAWLALDMRATTAIDAEAVEVILALARKRSRGGGRLCLMGLSPAWLARFRAEGWTREIDLASDATSLVSQNRRLISASERESLLDSVIEEEGL